LVARLPPNRRSKIQSAQEQVDSLIPAMKKKLDHHSEADLLTQVTMTTNLHQGQAVALAVELCALISQYEAFLVRQVLKMVIHLISLTAMTNAPPAHTA
jgi:hypothetical protein